MKPLVLFIEDDVDDRDLTTAAFKIHGFAARVEFARDGVEALRRLRGAGERPTLVVLDLNMPKLSGLEVLERIQADASLAGLPVVILSSSDERREMARAETLGAAGFLRKAEGFADFGRVVSDLNAALSRAVKNASSKK